MILAGIDEAGYGPLLGPLVVGCCAFDLSDIAGTHVALPDLWKRLRKHVGRHRSKSGLKLHVNDSKLVYSPSAGLRELERSVLSFVYSMEFDCDDFPSLLGCVAQHVLADLSTYPWYADASTAFPIENDGLSVKLFAKALREDMRRTQTRCVHLAARIVLERQLNRMFAATHNKASVLFSTAAIHLDQLLKQFGDKGLVVFCDRQGGREHYGSLLRLMFDEWSLEVVSEIPGRSEYRLHRGPHNVRLVFTEKAEQQCLSVALASMLSKYLREAMMDRFNRFWKAHVPEVEPTAGYYTDGLRFLQDIAGKRSELGIADDQIVRSR